jgi:hypothetical protein
MAKPLLEIRVDDMDSVPVIYYKGKPIKAKVSISYDWHTRTEQPGKQSIRIVHYDEEHKQKVIEVER